MSQPNSSQLPRHRSAFLRALSTAAAVTTVAGILFLPRLANADPGGPDKITIVTDPRLGGTSVISGYADGDAQRLVGSIADQSGVGQLIIDELVVSADTDAQMNSFLERRGATIVDTYPTERGEATIHLVRIPTSTAAVMDEVVRDLQIMEPQTRQLRVSEGRTLSMLGLLANEAARDGGVEVSFNWIDQADGVADGRIFEDPDHGNVFDWSDVSSTAPQAVGLDAAWQLLHGKGKLQPQVRAMISDGGFVENVDLPPYILRDDKWGAAGRMSTGSADAFHGTQVALTMAALQNNGKGVTGTAGPVIKELVAVAGYRYGFKTLRKLEDRAKEYPPCGYQHELGGENHCWQDGLRQYQGTGCSAASSTAELCSWLPPATTGITWTPTRP